MQRLVIIPTYNEKENIEAIITAVMDLPLDFNVLIIDDGSPDGTAAIVKRLMAGRYKDRLFLIERVMLRTEILNGLEIGGELIDRCFGTGYFNLVSTRNNAHVGMLILQTENILVIYAIKGGGIDIVSE